MAYGPLAYYLTRDILAALDPTAFRTGDSRYDLLRRILIAVGGQCSCSADSEFALLRKILIAIGGECKCNDSIWSLYSRILIQFRLNAGLPDVPAFAFRFGDNLISILQKILNVLQASPVPPVPPDLCCGLDAGDWGLLTAPVTEMCDWESITIPAVCFVDWGTVP